MSTSSERPWLRDLREAEGYLELGLLGRATRSLADVPPEHRLHPEYLALQFDLHKIERRWAEAAVVGRLLVERSPETAGWWINHAYATRRSEGILAAEAILREALTLHRREGLVHYNLACYCAQTGRAEQARNFLRVAFDLQPGLRLLADSDSDLVPLQGYLT